MIAVLVDHLGFHHKCLKQYTFSQILFREKTITTYHLKKCMVLLLQKYTDHHYRNGAKSKKTLPFVASIQHAKNVNLMVQCEECGTWRLIYSKKKLSSQTKSELERKLSNLDFSCGASTSDMDLPDELSNVHFRDLRCEDPVEKLYYSMGYEQICSTEDDLDTSENYYLICVMHVKQRAYFQELTFIFLRFPIYKFVAYNYAFTVMTIQCVNVLCVYYCVLCT